MKNSKLVVQDIYLGLWETLYNPNFKPLEFEGFRKSAGLNRFTLSSKQWIEKTGAIGLVSKQGRGGGTYAHKDIAFEFGTDSESNFAIFLASQNTINLRCKCSFIP